MKDTEANFHAMRRLVASRAGFAAFTNLPGFREKLGLKVYVTYVYVTFTCKFKCMITWYSLHISITITLHLSSDLYLLRYHGNHCQVIKSFKFDDDGVSHAAVDLIATLMQPMHDNYNLRQEQLNKSSLLSTKAFLEKLVCT